MPAAISACVRSPSKRCTTSTAIIDRTYRSTNAGGVEEHEVVRLVRLGREARAELRTIGSKEL